MWKLKVAERSDIFSTNNFIGRHFWEFDLNHGTPEERAQVDKPVEKYHENHFQVKPCSDALLEVQNKDGGWGFHIEGHSTMLGVRRSNHRDLVLSLRHELYGIPYDEIDWNKARHSCSKEDLYYLHPFIQNFLWDSIYFIGEPLLKRWPFSYIREKSLQKAIKNIHYEDQNTQYMDMASVEKVLNMLACWAEDPNSDAFKYHLARIHDYLWIAEDGMKMQNLGSQNWDTSFALQAIIASNLIDEYGSTLKTSMIALQAIIASNLM